VSLIIKTTDVPILQSAMPTIYQPNRQESSGFFSHFHLIFVILLLLSVPIQYALGTKYYAAKTGSNSNPGTLSSPWQTINYGASRLVNGDTLFVRSGVYTERVRPSGRKGGPGSNRRVIMAYPGESVTIDGTGVSTGGEGGGLVQFDQGYGYWNIRDITIRNSQGMGIYMGGTGCTVSNCIVHDVWAFGIYGGADSSIIEDCLVYNNSMQNVNGGTTTGYAPAITLARGANEGSFGVAGKDDTTDYGIIRRCTVHDSWGEGISTYESKHSLIEDCVVHDVWSVTLYISDAAYATVRRNLVYATKVMPGASSVRPGILVGNEIGVPFATGDSIYQNCVIGCRQALYLYNSTNGVCANNTFMDGTMTGTVWITYNSGIDNPNRKRYPFEHVTGWQFKNNIVHSHNPGIPNIYNSDPSSSITYSYNMVEAVDGSGYTRGTGDVVDTANIKRTGTFPTSFGLSYFDLNAGSRAIDAGTNIGLPYNGSAPDKGGRESGTAVAIVVPTAPSPLSPVDGATGVATNPTLSWSVSNGATWYWLQVSTTSDFAAPVFNATSIAGTTQGISGLVAGTRYYWRVKGCNNNYVSSWTAWSFTTTAAGGAAVVPSTPVACSPANGALVSGNPTLRWTRSAGAKYYHLQVSTTADFSTLACAFPALTDTAWSVGGLAGNTKYYWRVKGYNDYYPSAWSTAWSFTAGGAAVVPSTPVPCFPANVAPVSKSPTLRWTRSAGARYYHLQVSKTADFSTLACAFPALTDTVWSVGGLAGNTKYYWRVKGYNDYYPSAWSTAWNFTTNTKAAQVRYSSSSLSFGRVSVGQVAVQPLTVFNDGDDTLRVMSVTSTHAVFSFSCPQRDLPPGDSFTDSVRASSVQSPGAVTGMLIIQSNGSASVDTISLTVNVVTSDVNANSHTTPIAYSLGQNYPNPFNPTTTIPFALPETSPVTLEIFDMLGCKVRSLMNGQETTPGLHTVVWDGRSDSGMRVASGLYLCRIKTNRFSASTKMMLLQ
jgi:hypothetical protein